MCLVPCAILPLVHICGFSYPSLSWRVRWFFQGCPWEKERQRKGQETEWERESFCWWKWQWHWAYCLVKHTQPLPHVAWPSNRGQWNLLIGSRGPDRWRGNWAETVSFCCCHTQKMGWLQSQPLWGPYHFSAPAAVAEFMLLLCETQTDVTCNFTWNEHKLGFYRVVLFLACLKSNPR